MQEPWLQRLPWDILSMAAAKHGVDPMLAAAIVQTESSGNRFAIKYEKDWHYLVTPEKYAKELGVNIETETQLQMFSFGLTQIMGSIARELGYDGPMGGLFDTQTNLDLGCKKMSQCLKRYPKIEEAIASYNAGSARYIDGKIVNQGYVDRVLVYLGQAGAAPRLPILQ